MIAKGTEGGVRKKKEGVMRNLSKIGQRSGGASFFCVEKISVPWEFSATHKAVLDDVEEVWGGPPQGVFKTSQSVLTHWGGWVVASRGEGIVGGGNWAR